MLSVLHILSTLKLGGAEKFTVGLAKLQRQEGLDAQILNLGSEEDFLVQEVKSQKIPLIKRDLGMGRLKHYLRLRKIMSQFDVVHIHSPRTLHHLSFIIPFCSNKRFVYTRHGLFPLDSFYWKFLHRVINRYIDQVTFVTEAGCEVFLRNHKWPKEKLNIIENGTYLPESFKISTQLPIRFGSVGRMVKLKGQSILMDAIKALITGDHKLESEQFVLDFYGSGPVEDDLKELSNELPSGLVTFHGEVKDIEKIYENIDVLIVASQSEGLSMVIIEAMARGIPVIATDVGGNPTLVKNNKTGLLIPYGDPIVLAEAISTVLKKVDLVESFGRAARELIEVEFSLHDTHYAYLTCYKE